MSILVAIYNPAEFYPPTLNAVEALARKYDKVTLITHSVTGSKPWSFPPNVSVEYVAPWPSENDVQNFQKNINRFLKYFSRFRKILKEEKFKLVLLYEPQAALAYKLAGSFSAGEPEILWYHSHDIYTSSSQRKYSVGWWSLKAEKNIFKDLDIFSLPAEERKEYFPMRKLKGKYFFLPNYPSRLFYNKFYQPKQLGDSVKILYQGRIAPGHGLEEIIPILDQTINGKQLTLHLKGLVEDEYKRSLIEAAKMNQVEHRLSFYGITSYKEVPALAATCDIGIAIHTKEDIMNKTLGTSSNKIYEYAALGLPVLLYDNAHFRKHLEKYNWTAFTDCSKTSLQECFQNFLSDYPEISANAHRDFDNGLNFEKYFDKITEQIS